jgi:N-acetylneuraminic acid mutarotase
VDPATGHSDVTGRLAVAVHDSAGAALGGRSFVFGGGSFSTVSDIQAWTAGSATVLGSLPTPRSDLTAVTSGSTAYIVGGFDGTAMAPQILATPDGVTFRPVADLPVPVRYAAAGVVGGTLWVIGGVTSTSEGGTAETDAVQRVDLATGEARVAGRLAAPLGHAAAVVLGGQLFVVGGRSGGAPSAVIWRLDQGTGSLMPAGQLPQPLSDAGVVVVGGTGYIVGGEVTGPAAPLETVVSLRAVP